MLLIVLVLLVESLLVLWLLVLFELLIVEALLVVVDGLVILKLLRVSKEVLAFLIDLLLILLAFDTLHQLFTILMVIINGHVLLGGGLLFLNTLVVILDIFRLVAHVLRLLVHLLAEVVHLLANVVLSVPAIAHFAEVLVFPLVLGHVLLLIPICFVLLHLMMLLMQIEIVQKAFWVAINLILLLLIHSTHKQS